jgi:hypothetical protein
VRALRKLIFGDTVVLPVGVGVITTGCLVMAELGAAGEAVAGGVAAGVCALVWASTRP